MRVRDRGSRTYVLLILENCINNLSGTDGSLVLDISTSGPGYGPVPSRKSEKKRDADKLIWWPSFYVFKWNQQATSHRSHLAQTRMRANALSARTTYRLLSVWGALDTPRGRHGCCSCHPSYRIRYAMRCWFIYLARAVLCFQEHQRGAFLKRAPRWCS